MTNTEAIRLFLIACAIFAFGITLGSARSTSRWHQEAIEHGYAEYNQTTGDWQWKEQDSE